MSSYHVLESFDGGEKVQVVFHIPVPNTLNYVGTNLRTAFVAYKTAHNDTGSSIVPLLATSDPTEYAAIVAGQIYEHQEYVYAPDHDPLVKKATIDALYTKRSAIITVELADRFQFWGFNANVA